MLLLIGSLSFAQSNLTIFNNNGQQFFVILNGIKQNSIPLTNVSVGGIKNGSYSVKLIFADGKTADIDKNFFIEEPSDITTRIIFKKGKGKLQLIGMEPTKGTLPQSDVITYRPDNNTVYSDAVVITQTVTSQQTTSTNTNSSGETTNVQMNIGTGISESNEQVGVNMNVTETTNTTGVNQTIQVSDPNNPNGNVGLNIDIQVQDPTMGGENVNMSVNMNGTGTQTNQTNGNVQFTETVTTTISTTGTQTNSNINSSNNVNSAVPTNTNTVSCKNILGDSKVFIEDVKTMSFDEDKKDLIKTDLRNLA